ncbi:DMT family transporter [Eggerthella guodeyinii]|uniref:DMT family transporter n=1 Tax=Eggerthella guodeyinii TaxID=2690837 RepID=A0A6L7IST2_9ACTN|nr:DMT family transporter [Eggerthella guodeyinii]QOS68444.1 DMT family transporter [Eggerthella guodeyinii]
MADNNKDLKVGKDVDGSGGYEMKLNLGTIAMLISATGMGLVPLFSRWATRTDMFDGAAGFNAGDSIGALMAVGRMGMGVLFFVVLLVATHKVHVFKKLKLTPAIALGGLMIGMSLACYVTSTLLTTVSNAVLFIYIGPVICVLLARIFRKEPMSPLQWICLAAVFIGMLFGEGLLGFGVGGQVFGLDFNLVPSTPEFPMKGIGDAFGIASGFFYGASMFFNGYRKDADTTARGVWNFIFAVLGAGVITIVLNSLGATPGMENWALNVHFTTFNWIGAVLLWIICGPIALGFLLVAGRNLPAADYGTIAYWEVPVALFIGLVVFGEPFTINTALGAILIIGGGAIPSVKGMVAGRKHKQEVEIRENLAAKLAEEEAKEKLK